MLSTSCECWSGPTDLRFAMCQAYHKPLEIAGQCHLHDQPAANRNCRNYLRRYCYIADRNKVIPGYSRLQIVADSPVILEGSLSSTQLQLLDQMSFWLQDVCVNDSRSVYLSVTSPLIVIVESVRMRLTLPYISLHLLQQPGSQDLIIISTSGVKAALRMLSAHDSILLRHYFRLCMWKILQ